MTADPHVVEDEAVTVAEGRAQPIPGIFRHGTFLIIGLMLLGYVGVAALHAAFRPISYDEWFTYEEVRLPRLGQVIQGAGQGPEQAPPLHFLLTRVSLELIGDGVWGLRGPSIAGGGLLLACLYGLVARRFGSLYGLGAVAVALNGPAWFYATDSRPYALMLGFCALAIVCWRQSEPGAGRGFALVGLMLSVAAAVSSHYYATVGLIPLGLGQLVRSWRRRGSTPRSGRRWRLEGPSSSSISP